MKIPLMTERKQLRNIVLPWLRHMPPGIVPSVTPRFLLEPYEITMNRRIADARSEGKRLLVVASRCHLLPV